MAVAFGRLLREKESQMARKLLGQLGSVGSEALGRLSEVGPVRPVVERAKRVVAGGERLVRELKSVDRRLSAIERRLAAIEGAIRQGSDPPSTSPRLSRSKPRAAPPPISPLGADATPPLPPEAQGVEPGGSMP